MDNAVTTIELSAQTDSRIAQVSVYNQRAEVTRLCTFKVKAGQNQVHLNGLPNVLDSQSLRVEGRGKATIHDVTLSRISPPSTPRTSPELTSLEEERDLAQKALSRCKKSIQAMEAFVNTINAQYTEATSLDLVMDNYDMASEKVDRKMIALEKRIKDLEATITVEEDRLADTAFDIRLNQRVSVGVVAQEDSEVQLVVLYAVHKATWSASYDIRVALQEKGTPVTLIYKSLIKQDTGEPWDNVPVTLETATPTFGLGVPSLQPWKLSVIRPTHRKETSRTMLMSRVMSLQPEIQEARGMEESDDDMGFGLFDDEMAHVGSNVTSKGNVTATYRIPGQISIPADGTEKTFTIVELKLDASMSWISVPKVDPQTHLKAKIKNSSDYTLLSGDASVYLDGSFISRTHLGDVSPQETFDCALGLDPSVRVTYHTQNKKKSQTGFYTKSSVHVYSQRITVHNSKPSFLLENLKILDQIPVSEDEQISVKLVKPALSLPGLMSGTGKSKDASSSTMARGLPHVYVEDGVLAQWEGSDDTDVDVSSLGKDGKINFLCTVPAQGKVNLSLEWEITSPAKVIIAGL